VPVLERHLERVGVALSKTQRRRAGESQHPAQIVLFKQQGEAAMGGTHFHGMTTINGNVINLEGGGQVDARMTPVPQVLAAVLPGVLRASDPASAERLLRSLETLRADREVQAGGVAEVVQSELATDVEKARPAVRRRPTDFGTSATAGVIAQGIMLGIKALVGG
jgi:hypothetical protein